MTASGQRTLVITLIFFGVLAVGFFGFRTIHAFREFRSHRPPPPPFKNEKPETDVELIRDWMTIPFIGRMYHVPPPLIFEALDIPMEKNEGKSLRQLNDEYYPQVKGYVEAKVKAVVLENLPVPTAVLPATAIPPATVIPTVSP